MKNTVEIQILPVLPHPTLSLFSFHRGREESYIDEVTLTLNLKVTGRKQQRFHRKCGGVNMCNSTFKNQYLFLLLCLYGPEYTYLKKTYRLFNSEPKRCLNRELTAQTESASSHSVRFTVFNFLFQRKTLTFSVFSCSVICGEDRTSANNYQPT